MSPGWPNGGTRRALRPAIPAQAGRRTRGTETSQYPAEEKSTGASPGAFGPFEITGVAASETVRGPNRRVRPGGVVGPTGGPSGATRSPLERGARGGESPVGDGCRPGVAEFLSSARHEQPGAKPGGPPSKAEDSRVTDSGRVP